MNLFHLIGVPLAIAGVGAVLYGLHRFAIHLEERGLLYYRKKPEGGGGNVLMDLDKLTRPSMQHVIEVKEVIHEEQQNDGD